MLSYIQSLYELALLNLFKENKAIIEAILNA